MVRQPVDPIRVFMDVSERDVLQWRRKVAIEGRRDDVPAYLRLADGTDYALAGRINYVDNQVDAATGTLRIGAEFPNPDGLLVPGIFVHVRVPAPQREALLVPETALQRDLVGHYLLGIGDDGTVIRVPVEPGATVRQYREITGGLLDTHTIIINGLQRVRPGVRVTPQRATLQPPQPMFTTTTRPATTRPTGEGA